MKSILKWFLIIGGVFFLLLVAALIIDSQFIYVKKHIPVIEAKVTQATGRSFSMGEDIDLSVFPWVGVKVTDVLFGNPEGFSNKQMISVKKFEVRLKVMPLLSRKIEVNTFVLEEPVIHLEKLKNGTANWTGIGGGDKAKGEAKPKADPSPSGKGLPISELRVDNFAITNGRLIYIDQTTGTKKQITDLNLALSDISLDQPVNIRFDANLDGKPVSVTGKAGPIGSTPGKGSMAFDMAANLLDELKVTLAGSVTDPATALAFDVLIDVASFSPKKVMAALDQPFPVKTRDPGVLEKVAVKTKVTGSPTNIVLSDGVLILDDSTLNFSAAAKAFQKPDLAFDLQLDTIDLDRYLPESESKKGQEKKEKASKPGEKKIDYEPLRRLVLDGKIKVGQLRASGATVQDIVVHVLAKNGIITVDPMDAKLYQGSVDSSLKVNVQKSEPRTAVKLSAGGIQAGPMLVDVTKKELIEGTLNASIDIVVKGDTPDRVKQSLTGKGQLLFNDGAIIGIDLANSVRNVKSKLGMGETPTEKPRTDFAELKIPFTAKSGLVTIDGTSLSSPLLRILMDGKVDLPKEGLDIRVEPKFVATLKGQGDTTDRSGFMVPVMITGTFASPKIRPDLKGMIGGGGAIDAEGLKKSVMGSGGDPKEQVETQKKDIKKQLNNFLPGITD